MKTEFIKQYAHTWRVFAGIVKDFDADAWFHTGRGVMLPVRVAFHVLKATAYYLEDSSTVVLAAGKPFDGNWEAAKEEDRPTQNDILAGIEVWQAKTETWLIEMDFDAENQKFGWAGETQGAWLCFCCATACTTSGN